MNFATNYLGLKLRNPIIVGASPFCDDIEVALQLQDAGAAAMVMRSFFSEQFASPSPALVADSAEGVASSRAVYPFSADQYLRQITHLKQALSIPVIASLNGCYPGSWTSFATQLESAGADAIELNAYQVVASPGVAADQVETGMLETLREIVSAVRIPVSVKISPFHTSVAQLAVALELSGSAGIVVFNRFYQPDMDIHELEVQPQLRLSDRSELLLRLRWLAILSPQLRGSLSASGGIQTADDIVKALLTGAHTVQLVSVLLRHGPRLVTELLIGLQHWMERHGYQEPAQFRGLLNVSRYRDPAAFERANYIHILQSWRM